MARYLMAKVTVRLQLFFVSSVFRAVTLGLLMGVSYGVSANSFYAVIDGEQHGVTEHSFKLKPLSSFRTPFLMDAVAAGLDNDVYLVSGRRIYHYTAAGRLIKQLTHPDATVKYTDIAVSGDRVYVSYSGHRHGIAVYNLTLKPLSGFRTTFVINAMAVAANDDVYVASANSIYRYQATGILLTSITFSDKTLVYTHMAVTCGKVLSAYTGTQNGVSVRDLNTLAQSSSFSTAFKIKGLTVGKKNDLYLSTEHYLLNVTLTGIEKQRSGESRATYLYGNLTQ